MAEPVKIVAAALTSAAIVVTRGRQAYSLLQVEEDLPEHVEQLSERLSSFNSVLTSIHTAIVQEAAKFDHDSITISQLDHLPPLLNHCATQLTGARSLLGNRDSPWGIYRKDDLLLMSRKLQDYNSTLTLGCFALTIAKSTSTEDVNASILHQLESLQTKLAKTRRGFNTDEILLNYLSEIQLVFLAVAPASELPTQPLGVVSGHIYEPALGINTTVAPSAAKSVPEPSALARRTSRLSRIIPFRRFQSPGPPSAPPDTAAPQDNKESSSRSFLKRAKPEAQTKSNRIESRVTPFRRFQSPGPSSAPPDTAAPQDNKDSNFRSFLKRRAKPEPHTQSTSIDQTNLDRRLSIDSVLQHTASESPPASPAISNNDSQYSQRNNHIASNLPPQGQATLTNRNTAATAAATTSASHSNVPAPPWQQPQVDEYTPSNAAAEPNATPSNIPASPPPPRQPPPPPPLPRQQPRVDKSTPSNAAAEPNATLSNIPASPPPPPLPRQQPRVDEYTPNNAAAEPNATPSNIPAPPWEQTVTNDHNPAAAHTRHTSRQSNTSKPPWYRNYIEGSAIPSGSNGRSHAYQNETAPGGANPTLHTPSELPTDRGVLPSTEIAIRQNGFYQQDKKTFIDTPLSRDLAGDDAMVQAMMFRHAPEDWRDPITEFCHSEFVRLQRSSGNLDQVFKNYEKYRELVKPGKNEPCTWQFQYRNYKIKYEKFPLPAAKAIKLHLCQNTEGERISEPALSPRTVAYIFEDCLVVGRQSRFSKTRCFKVVGYLHYQKVKAIDMPAYGSSVNSLAVRCQNGALTNGMIIGDIRFQFDAEIDKRYVKDTIVRWAAVHNPKSVTAEEIAMETRLRNLQGREFMDPVTGKSTTGEDLENYYHAVNQAHSNLKRNTIGSEEVAQLFNALQPKFEALPEDVRHRIGGGTVSAPYHPVYPGITASSIQPSDATVEDYSE